jgi:hypothetical protein
VSRDWSRGQQGCLEEEGCLDELQWDFEKMLDLVEVELAEVELVELRKVELEAVRKVGLLVVRKVELVVVRMGMVEEVHQKERRIQ